MADSSNTTGGMGAAGGTAFGAAIGGIIGMGQGAINTNQNRKAQERAFTMQKELNQQGKDLALQQWKDTNYSAQRKELEKAGLNAGLLYGQSGGGGTTANAGSGGSAPNQAPANYDIGMALQGAQQMAQMRLMEAQTNKTNAEAENLRGADRDNTLQDTALKATQTQGNELANKLAGKTIDDRAEIVKHELLKTAGQGQQEQAKGGLAVARENVALEQDKANVAYAIAKTKLSESGIEVNDASIAKMAQDIAIGKFNAETSRNTIGIDKVSGTLLQNIVNEIYNAIGYDKDRADQKVNDGKK